MTKKRKIILISLAVTLALSVGVGGFVYANYGLGPHEETGGNKLIGVGEMGYDTYSVGGIQPVSTTSGGFDQDQWWDTQFIITNPNCERPLTIEWVALIASEDVTSYEDGAVPIVYWGAEDVIFEGTPDDWYGECGIEIPGNVFSETGVLSPHEVWQVSIAELIAGGTPWDPEEIVDDWALSKYTLEVTWSGARYTGWWWWGYWRSGRPLTGWQKEKCWYVNYYGDYNNGVYGVPDGPINYDLVVNNTYIYSDSGMAISEAEMKVFPSRRPFSPPDWWHLEE